MTQTSSFNRLFILSALFAVAACGLLQTVVTVEGENMTALLTSTQLNGRVLRMSPQSSSSERALTSAQRRRLRRVASHRSASSATPISAFRIHAIASSSARSFVSFSSTSNAALHGVAPLKEVCGDGLVTGTEQCDDENTVGNDGCSSVCAIEDGFTCFNTQPSFCQSTCGDGVVATSEKCDDGNTVNSDGCDSQCMKEVGWTCSGSPSACTSTFSICGDGRLTGAETCDDGNSHSGDGCSSSCTVETDYTCAGTPSACAK